MAANDWLLSKYEAGGVPAEKEQYGTWRAWDRGITHIDLIAPRKRSLNGMMLAWSPGTDGPVEGDVVAFPSTFQSPADFQAWLPEVRGKIVMFSAPEATCRAPESWQALATPESQVRIGERQSEIDRTFGASRVNQSCPSGPPRQRLQIFEGTYRSSSVTFHIFLLPVCSTAPHCCSRSNLGMPLAQS